MHWDVFCRVIDNYGDIGVCWRLAADLAARGDTVRLWSDDASALAWMAPGGAAGVELRPWPSEQDDSHEPHDAVVEAFGCRLPAGFVRRMALRAAPPVWINLEYLSAETYVEQCHGLMSPQATEPARGLRKWFFYPGFARGTGGLLREPDLPARRAAFDPVAWRSGLGIALRAGERCVSLFCYANDALPGLLDALAAGPTLLLVTPGLAAEQVRGLLGPAAARGALRAHYLTPLPQVEYDCLLWSCDLNLVRGEDSFVRAQWAGRPFLWQLYPQQDMAHAGKLAAFLGRFLDGAAPALGAAVGTAFRAWNGLDKAAGDWLPDRAAWPAWEAHSRGWRDALEALPDLTSGLRAFALEHR